MGTSNQDRIKGSMDSIKGKAKRMTGVAIGNQELEAEGAKDQLKGKLEKAKANVKDTLTKTINKT